MIGFKGAEGADGTGTRSWTTATDCASSDQNIAFHFSSAPVLESDSTHKHEERKKKKKEGSCCVSRRIAEACSSWQVISAFGSTLLTLIMQLNAALRIPAAAHPHYNTVLPLSPTLSVTHTHTNQSVSPPPTPFHDHNLKHPRLKTAFFVSLQATPLQRHDCGNAFVFSRESARLDVHAASHRAEKNTST